VGIQRTVGSILLGVSFLASSSQAAEPTRGNCAVGFQSSCPEAESLPIPPGKWSRLSKTGTEVFSGIEDLGNALGCCTNEATGTFSIAQTGEASSNYIELSCDGSVTGQGRDSFDGSLFKFNNVGACYQFYEDGVLSLDYPTQINRQYTVTGQLLGDGTFDLEYHLTGGGRTWSETEVYFRRQAECTLDEPFTLGPSTVGFPLPAGDTYPTDLTDQVEIAGSLNGDESVLTATEVSRDQFGEHERPVSWLHWSMDWTDPKNGFPVIGPFVTTRANNTFATTQNVTSVFELRTPLITDGQVDAPAFYLEAVPVDVTLTATIDWKASTGTREVTFDYGTTTETVAASGTTAQFTFDAGDAASEIVMTPEAGPETGAVATFGVPKVVVPNWAGGTSAWSA
jgi:hypothetical protein